MPATIEASDRRFLTETASTRQKLRLRHFSGLQSVTIFAPRWGVSSEDLILEALGDSDDGTAPGLSMAVYSATDDVNKNPSLVGCCCTSSNDYRFEFSGFYGNQRSRSV